MRCLSSHHKFIKHRMLIILVRVFQREKWLENIVKYQQFFFLFWFSYYPCFLSDLILYSILYSMSHLTSYSILHLNNVFKYHIHLYFFLRSSIIFFSNQLLQKIYNWLYVTLVTSDLIRFTRIHNKYFNWVFCPRLFSRKL